MMYSTALDKRVAVLIGELGAQQEAVGTERVDGTAQCRCVAMAYGVVPQPVHGLPGASWVSGASHGTWCPPRNHRQRTPEMRADDLDRGILLQMSGGDELHRGDGVLERRSHHPGDVMLADQRRA